MLGNNLVLNMTIMSVRMHNPASKRKLNGEPELYQDWKDAFSNHSLKQQLKRIEVREIPKRETRETASQRTKK